jgi:hypothetical protein
MSSKTQHTELRVLNCRLRIAGRELPKLKKRAHTVHPFLISKTADYFFMQVLINALRSPLGLPVALKSVLQVFIFIFCAEGAFLGGAFLAMQSFTNALRSAPFISAESFLHITRVSARVLAADAEAEADINATDNGSAIVMAKSIFFI